MHFRHRRIICLGGVSPRWFRSIEPAGRGYSQGARGSFNRLESERVGAGALFSRLYENRKKRNRISALFSRNQREIRRVSTYRRSLDSRISNFRFPVPVQRSTFPIFDRRGSRVAGPIRSSNDPKFLPALETSRWTFQVSCRAVPCRTVPCRAVRQRTPCDVYRGIASRNRYVPVFAQGLCASSPMMELFSLINK